MVVKYEWRCDRRDGHKPKVVRAEFRVPESLHAVLSESAQGYGVSLNAFVNGLLSWACQAHAHKRFIVDVAHTKLSVKEVVTGRDFQ